MKDTNDRDDWRSLCELASKEKDPQKLLDLVTKINRALEECRKHTQTEQTSFKVDTVLLPNSVSAGFESDHFLVQPSLAIEYDC